MRAPSCVVYRGMVALCVSEVAGRIEARGAGGARMWLTAGETEEATGLLAYDRLMLADGGDSHGKRGEAVASVA